MARGEDRRGPRAKTDFDFLGVYLDPIKPSFLGFPLRFQVPNNHILSKILTYITTIRKPSTQLLGPLDPWGP